MAVLARSPHNLSDRVQVAVTSTVERVSSFILLHRLSMADESNAIIDQENKPEGSPNMATNSLKRKAVDLATAEAKKPKANASITSFFGAPKSNPSTSSTTPSDPPVEPAPVQFDKDEWVKGLSDEQRSLLKLEIETLHESWLGVLKDHVTSKSFLNLKKFLKEEGEKGTKIFPPLEDVYSWSVELPRCRVLRPDSY